MLSEFINLKKCNIHRATGDVNIRFKGWSTRKKPIPKSIIVVFNENILLFSTCKFIVIPIKYHNCGAFTYDSAGQQMLSAISLVIEQRKNELDRIAKVGFPHLFVWLARVILLSEHLPGFNFSREGDIARTQNLLISYKSSMCKLNYSHVIK